MDSLVRWVTLRKGNVGVFCPWDVAQVIDVLWDDGSSDVYDLVTWKSQRMYTIYFMLWIVFNVQHEFVE